MGKKLFFVHLWFTLLRRGPLKWKELIVLEMKIQTRTASKLDPGGQPDFLDSLLSSFSLSVACGHRQWFYGLSWSPLIWENSRWWRVLCTCIFALQPPTHKTPFSLESCWCLLTTSKRKQVPCLLINGFSLNSKQCHPFNYVRTTCNLALHRTCRRRGGMGGEEGSQTAPSKFHFKIEKRP